MSWTPSFPYNSGSLINSQSGTGSQSSGTGTLVSTVAGQTPRLITKNYILKELCGQLGGTMSASFARSNSASTRKYLFDAVSGYSSVQDTRDIITWILGQTLCYPQAQDGTNSNFPAGCVPRQLPRCDPQYPMLYAESVSNFQGEGQYVAAIGDIITTCPPIGIYDLYEAYSFDVTFTSRPYPIPSTVQSVTTAGKYWDYDGTPKAITYCTEWLRFCEIDRSAMFNNVTAKQGEMLLRMPGQTPATRMFPAMPRIQLPDTGVQITWHDIPYRYVTSPNSYFQRLAGTINQNPWLEWGAGELLYLTWEAKRYTPPIAQMLPTGANGAFEPATAQTCDIIMKFNQTKRKLSGANPGVANPNFIVGGHNLLPNISDRSGYFYASVNITDPTKQYPSWMSTPFELLFTDPDLPQVPFLF